MSAVVDVRSPSEVNSWTATTVEKLGPLDGAANIAGMLGEQAPIRDATDQDWESVMGVNAKGVFNCLRAQFNNIKEGGSIVNVGSIASLVARPAQGTYVASKHAVLGLTRTAAREEGARGVRVNCVAPGICSPTSSAQSILDETEPANVHHSDFRSDTNGNNRWGRRRETPRNDCETSKY